MHKEETEGSHVHQEVTREAEVEACHLQVKEKVRGGAIPAGV